jgi:two-component system LytT family response regulator
MPKELKAVIVDDERLARRELTTMLELHPEVAVVGEADSVAAAAKKIHSEEPDLVFLDIQLAGESGFDLLDKLTQEVQIIFVTAYQEHAVRAFDVNALDYLLKPVTRERLSEALVKVRKPTAPLEQAQGPLAYDDRMFVRLDGRMAFLRIDSIKFVTADRDYSYVHTTDGRRRMVNKPLKEWENRLPDSHFLRIHRSTIVAMDYVKRLEPWSNYTYLVFLDGSEEPLTMSRRYAAKAKKQLG